MRRASPCVAAASLERRSSSGACSSSTVRGTTPAAARACLRRRHWEAVKHPTLGRAARSRHHASHHTRRLFVATRPRFSCVRGVAMAALPRCRAAEDGGEAASCCAAGGDTTGMSAHVSDDDGIARSAAGTPGDDGRRSHGEVATHHSCSQNPCAEKLALHVRVMLAKQRGFNSPACNVSSNPWSQQNFDFTRWNVLRLHLLKPLACENARGNTLVTQKNLPTTHFSCQTKAVNMSSRRGKTQRSTAAETQEPHRSSSRTKRPRLPVRSTADVLSCVVHATGDGKLTATSPCDHDVSGGA